MQAHMKFMRETSVFLTTCDFLTGSLAQTYLRISFCAIFKIFPKKIISYVFQHQYSNGLPVTARAMKAIIPLLIHSFFLSSR